MLLDLLAFGALTVSAGATPVYAASASVQAIGSGGVGGGTTTDTLPLNAAAWVRPFDPSDNKPYSFDWSAELASSEKLSQILLITRSPRAVELGVLVDSGVVNGINHDAAINDAGKLASLWFRVDPAFRSNAAFDGAGTRVGIAMLVLTDAGETMEITMILTVRQR